MNKKVILSEGRFGKCLIVAEDILKDEEIVSFDGDEYTADKITDLSKDVADHAIQFAEHQWRDSNSIARYINHSCNPNCGIKNLFTLVAMKDIKKGEELLWDYDMTEDSDWRMDCLCGAENCRKVIGSFALVPNETRERYKGYISQWLVEKYKL